MNMIKLNKIAYKFIAQIFSQNGFRHLQTIKRKISNKSMPFKNSPSNKSGFKSSTMSVS